MARRSVNPMTFALFLLNSLLLGLALINFISIRKPSAIAETDASILVLLPVRNEEANIARVLTELNNQKGVPNLHIAVIDDNSEDRTHQITQAYVSERISLVTAPEPQAGLIGKVNALQSGFNSERNADVVISVDADVHFQSDAIARAINTLNASGLDFISPYPRQIAISFGERLVQPLLQWSWMSTVLLRGAEKFPMKSTVVCNGQFLVMRHSSLKTIGGFTTVANKVLDDIELGRAFVDHGFKGAVIDGSTIASTRMYSSFDEIRAGYGKSLNSAFGSIAGSTLAALFMVATGIAPFVFAISGNLLAIAACVAVIGTRVISAASSSGRMRDSFLHPVSAALFIYLLYFSWRNRGAIQWKGRTV